MAKKATLTPVTDTALNAGAINTQLNAINDKLDNTLSLDGSTPNAMNADVDMNSNDILNAGTVSAAELTVGGISVAASATASAASATASAASAAAALVSETNAATSETNAASSAVAASAYDPTKRFNTVALLLADTTLTTSNTTVGDYFEAGGFRYIRVASSGDVTTAGGIQLQYVSQPRTTTLTVGTGGDYTTINAALEDLSSRSPVHKATQEVPTLQLLTGFVMDEQVLVDGVDLGWIEITSVDATVTITGSSMDTDTIPVDGGSARYAFGADNGGTLPNINTLFTVDGTGSALKRHGIVLIRGSRAYVGSGFGITNAPSNGVTLDGGSLLLANTSNFSNAGAYGAFLYGASRMVADYANFSFATDDCVIVTRGSTANISSSNCSNAGVNGLLATQGSVVVAGEINVNDSGSSGIRARGASTINANSCTALRCSTGIYADRGCRISITDDSGSADFTGCTSYSLQAFNGGEIIGKNVQCGAARINVETGGRLVIPGVTVATTTASHHGIQALTGGYVNAEGGTISAAGTSARGISCNGSDVWANNSTITSTSNVAVYADGGGDVHIEGSVISVLGSSAACFIKGGRIYAAQCTFNAVGSIIFDSLHGGLIDAGSATIVWSGVAPATAFRVKDGATINVSGTTEGASVTVNTISANGIVIQ
jgi:hypothetical protein